VYHGSCTTGKKNWRAELFEACAILPGSCVRAELLKKFFTLEDNFYYTGISVYTPACLRKTRVNSYFNPSK